MSYDIKIRPDGKRENLRYYIVKGKYSVRVEGDKASCTCMGGMFKTSGREQCICKHAYEVLKRLGKI